MLEAKASIGVTDASYASWVAIRDGYNAHLATCLFDDYKEYSIIDSYRYWKNLQSDPKTEPLATHACNILRRPMTSAICERVFSYLTKMDAAARRSMDAKSLRENLFIRANHHIVERLILRFLDAGEMAREEREASFKAKAVAENTAAIAKAIKKAEKTPSKKRKRGEGEEEEEEEEEEDGPRGPPAA